MTYPPPKKVARARIRWVFDLLNQYRVPIDPVLSKEPASTAGIETTPASVSDDWVDARTCLELFRFADQYISIEQAAEAGREFLHSSDLALTLDACRIIFSVRDAYLFFFGPDSYYTRELPVVSTLVHTQRNELAFALESADGTALPNTLFHFLHAQMEYLPSVLGQSNARVETAPDRAGIIHVYYRGQRSFLEQRSHKHLYQEAAARLAQHLLATPAASNRNPAIPEPSSIPESLPDQFESIADLLTETTLDAAFVLDGQLNIIYANPSACEMFHHARDHLKRMKITDLLPTSLIDSALKPAFNRGVTSRGFAQGITATRSLIPVDVYFSGIRSPASGYSICVVRDLTHHTSAGEIVHSLEHQLQSSQKMNTLGQLSSEMVHDFNNLLIAIEGYAELASKASDRSTAEQYLKEVLKSTRRGTLITRQLLDFARPDENDQNLIEAAHLLTRAFNLIRMLMPDNIEVCVEQAPANTLIMADATRLEQVLVNLAINARDAMPGGGTLKLSAHIPDSEDRQRILITVQDDGTGISEPVQARLFDPLFTTKQAGKGTGLGLPIVRKIVEEHAGHLTLESSEGKGTCFTVDLPVAEAAPPIAASSANTSSPLKDMLNILLVEDEDQVRQLVRLMCKAAGHQVDTLDNGSEALTALSKDSNYDLVLMDIALPGMGGLETAREITSSYPRLPVLLMSGYAADHPMVRDARTQFSILAKPFNSTTLLDSISTLLSGRSEAIR